MTTTQVKSRAAAADLTLHLWMGWATSSDVHTKQFRVNLSWESGGRQLTARGAKNALHAVVQTLVV